MYKITWDSETGGILLNLKVAENTLSVAPRPVFWEELDLLGLEEQGWKYPHCDEPLMWACNKQYFYRGQYLFDAQGANIYDFDKHPVEFRPWTALHAVRVYAEFFKQHEREFTEAGEY